MEHDTAFSDLQHIEIKCFRIKPFTSHNFILPEDFVSLSFNRPISCDKEIRSSIRTWSDFSSDLDGENDRYCVENYEVGRRYS